MIRLTLSAIVLIGLCCLVAAKEPAAAPTQARPTTMPDGFLPDAPSGQQWKLIWNDEFDGTALDMTKWAYRPDGKRQDGYWNHDAVSLDGQGHLLISAKEENGKFISGCIDTAGRFEHAFGYYTCRVRFQKQPGHWSAFWLQCAGTGRVGDEGRDGTEIDIFEKPHLDDSVEHNLHWDGYGKDHKHAGQKVNIPGINEGWHTVGLWWKHDEYVFYIDGKETWRTHAGGVSQVPEYIMFSNEIGKRAGKITDAKLPDNFAVDYARVYDLVEKP